MDLNRLKLSQIDTSDIASSEFASSNSVNLVQDNVAALPDSAANDYATYTTLTGLIDTVQDNVAALDNNVWVNANDYATYTTLSGLIDTVQDNVASQTSNTQIYLGNTLYSNTSIFMEAGDGVTLSGNTTSKTITFAVQMGNVTSQVISLDGSANSFTINQSAANSNMLLVFYNGLAQDPTEYSVDDTTLTLNNTDPIISSSKLEVRHFDFFDVPGASESNGNTSFQGTHYYVTNSSIVGENSTASQDILGVGVTLEANTFYEFEGNFNFFKTAGTTSHTFSFQWGGTATFDRIVTNMLVQSSAQGFVTVNAVRGIRQYVLESVGPFAVNDAVTNSFYTVNLQVRGIIKVANGGTLIPQYKLSAAPGGAYTASTSNNMSIRPLGPSSNNNFSIGSWS